MSSQSQTALETNENWSQVLSLSAERYLKIAGELFIYDGDFEAALVMVNKSLSQIPDDVRGLVLKGDILFCLHQDDEALLTFNYAVMLAPTCVEAHLSRAGVLESMGQYQEALKSCMTAFQHCSPEDYEFLLPTLYEQRIHLLIQLSRYHQAMAVLREAETLLPLESAEYLTGCYRTPLVQRRERRRPRVHPARPRHLRVVHSQSAPAFPVRREGA